MRRSAPRWPTPMSCCCSAPRCSTVKPGARRGASSAPPAAASMISTTKPLACSHSCSAISGESIPTTLRWAASEGPTGGPGTRTTCCSTPAQARSRRYRAAVWTVMLLGGGALVALGVCDVGARPIDAIELLVRWRDRRRALATLRALGWTTDGRARWRPWRPVELMAPRARGCVCTPACGPSEPQAPGCARGRSRPPPRHRHADAKPRRSVAARDRCPPRSGPSVRCAGSPTRR